MSRVLSGVAAAFGVSDLLVNSDSKLKPLARCLPNPVLCVAFLSLFLWLCLWLSFGLARSGKSSLKSRLLLYPIKEVAEIIMLQLLDSAVWLPFLHLNAIRLTHWTDMSLNTLKIWEKKIQMEERKNASESVLKWRTALWYTMVKLLPFQCSWGPL